MWKREGFALLRVLSILLCTLSGVHAALPGTGEWTMFGNGPGHAGFYPKTIGSGTFTQAWTKSFSTPINQVVIRADTIYGTTNGYFTAGMRAFALSGADGSEKWSYPLPDCFSVNPPAYSDGRIYFQRGNHSGDTHLWCLDAASGRLQWAAPHAAQWERYLAPTVAGGGVFVNGGDYGGVYGFDASTGSQRFFVSLGRGDGWTPSYVDGVLYTCVKGIFTAYNPTTGSQLCTLDLKSSSTGSGGNYWDDGDVPAISEGKAAIIGGNRLLVTDLASRSQLWSTAAGYMGTPAIADGIVYAILGSEVKAYDALTGSLKGTYTATGTLSGQPLVTNDLLIASSSSGTCIFDRNTFTLKQTLSTGGSVSYAAGTLCVVSGAVFGNSTPTLTSFHVEPVEDDPAPAPLQAPTAPESHPNPALPLGTTTTAWLDAVRADGIVYFLFDNPAKLERYEVASGTWLEPISLPATPKAFTASANGIYVSFGTRISAFSTDGKTETPLVNTMSETRSLFELNGKLYLADQWGWNWSAVDATTGVVIDAKSFDYSQKGVSVARSSSQFFAVSPDIFRTTINSDGTFGQQKRSPYYSDYPTGSRTFVFPGEGRVVSDAGIIYSASDLTYLGSLAGSFKDLDFAPGEAPVVLRNSTLVAYSNTLLETGRVALTGAPQRIFIGQGKVHAFSQMNGRGVTVTATPLDSLLPPPTGPSIDPTILVYTPDAMEFDGAGTVYLLSKLHQSIFRWSVSERKYLPSISLDEVPQFMAYSKGLNRLYLSYDSGRIRYLDLSSSSPSEMNFVNSPLPPQGLTVVDDYLFVSDRSGARGTHYIYDPTGKLASSKEWNYYSREYIWNSTNRKLYFFRDDASPNDLIWEDVNIEGKLGDEKDSPYHGDYDVVHPIRVSPDGSQVVLGNGHVYTGVSLEKVGALANAVTDAVWQGGNLYTVRSVTPLGGSKPTEGQLQEWNSSYQPSATGPSNGVPLRLFPLADGLLVISQVDGKLRFARHGLDFAQISSDPGSNPPPPTGRESHPNPSRPLGDTSVAWIDSAEANGIAYFLFDTPAKIERYDLTAASWLAPISLPPSPKAFAASPDGIFVSFGTNVSIFSLDGTTETPLFIAASAMHWLHEIDGKLYVATMDRDLGVVNITNGAVMAAMNNIWDLFTGFSFCAPKNKLFARDANVSPSDIHSIELKADGSFGVLRDSPYHGDYPDASRTFVFPDGNRIVDNSGIIYSTTDLTYAGSLAGAFDDLAFSGATPVVLRGNTLIAYTSSLGESGRATVSGTPLRLFVSGQNAFTFALQSGRGVTVAKTPLSTISTPKPPPAVDPSGLTYTPDEILMGPDDTVFLLSRKYRNVFRWSVPQRRYLQSIPLFEAPQHLAYAEASQRLYLSYSSGRISWIDLNSTRFVEQPFANTALGATGIAAAGEFLFAADPSGAWATHYTYSPSGTLISSEDWNRRSEEYIWSSAQRKMYFFRDDISPNDLHAEPIDAEGKLGLMTETPYHGGYSFIHPIRVAPDGSVVVLGTGDIYDATSLNHLGSLPVSLIDAGWRGNKLLTIRKASFGNGELQAWKTASVSTGGMALSGDRQPVSSETELVKVGTPSLYPSSNSASFQGRPLRLFPINNGVIVISLLKDKPRFAVFNDALKLLSADSGSNASPEPDPSTDWSEVAGTYTAVIGTETDRKLGNTGLLKITLTKTGRFSGTIRLGSRTLPVRGSFDQNGQTLLQFSAGDATYTATLQLDITTSIPQLRGTMVAANWEASVTGSRIWSSPGTPCPWTGRYTVLLNDSSEFLRETVPPVAAVGTMQVNRSGSAQITVLYPGGSRMSFAGGINESGSWNVYAVGYNGNGHLQGTINFADTEKADATGTLHWMKPLQINARYYPLDISTDLEFTASRYRWLQPALDVEFSFPKSNTAAIFIAGDLKETTGQATYLDRYNRLLFAKDTESTQLKFALRTGFVTGSFVHPRLGRRVPVNAVFFQKRNAAFGYFPGIQNFGIFFFGPPPTTSSAASSSNTSAVSSSAISADTSAQQNFSYQTSRSSGDAWQGFPELTNEIQSLSRMPFR